MKLIKFFRWIAIAEGISFLILLGIAMPLKYMYNWPDAVKFFGMVHGVLFVAFVMLAFSVMNLINKGLGWLLKAMILSIIPLGTFYLDREMKKERA